MKKWLCLLLAGVLTFSLAACGSSEQSSSSQPPEQPPQSESVSSSQPQPVEAPEGFVLLTGGSFQMGSPDEEAWRNADETLHEVTVSDFTSAPMR